MVSSRIGDSDDSKSTGCGGQISRSGFVPASHCFRKAADGADALQFVTGMLESSAGIAHDRKAAYAVVPSSHVRSGRLGAQGGRRVPGRFADGGNRDSLGGSNDTNGNTPL